MCAMHIVLSNWASCATATADLLISRLSCSKRCRCPSAKSQMTQRSSLSLSESQHQQEPQEPHLLLCRLPEAVQIQILGMCTVKDCLSLALSNRWTCREIWENSRLWQSLLIGMDAQRQDVANLSALQLRDKFRWEHFGINVLASGQEFTEEDKRTVLQRAERAVRAMLPKDAVVAQNVTKALGAIMNNASDESGRSVPEEHRKALISAVTSQDEVFTMEQTLDLVSVHHQVNARSPPPTPKVKSKLPRNQGGGRIVTQKKKPVQPPSAFNDEVFGRLSSILSDVASDLAVCAPVC